MRTLRFHLKLVRVRDFPRAKCVCVCVAFCGGLTPQEAAKLGVDKRALRASTGWRAGYVRQ